ncbi:hypothetical protein HMPREF3226_00101 [Prevotella corporis]|uniref:Uncharacterized protein n=1 Tax=Prevotella corporis TaxID=28128 RepID=A0A133QQG7_9BACT|nr:hypothetical protein HMPREF3226_00101 [Prevotella corporis]
MIAEQLVCRSLEYVADYGDSEWREVTDKRTQSIRKPYCRHLIVK